MKKVTIQDVAKELNLSRNTVAKALNNSPSVAYETRYVVIKKAYEMGYSKLLPVILKEFKISDRLNDTKTIVVLARRELSTFWNRIIMGISDELNKKNCSLRFNFICLEEEEELKLPSDFDNRCDGVIVLTVFKQNYIDKIVAQGVPIVFLDGPVNTIQTQKDGDIVLFEGINSIAQITSHMIKEGARRIGFIGDITYCRTIYERYKGYSLAMSEAGLPIDKEICMTGQTDRHYYIYEEIEAALDALPYMPDGIVCANDDIAKDVIAYLRDRGILIPKEVMVSGFDNKDETAFLTPSLTTAYVSNQRMGRRLVQQLMWRIENPEMPYETITVNTEVIFRESTIRNK
ncbi:MAG: LacI family DNA-binding transcriptional regulator [bacterium]|nr:LacI family DNA-binding transcriptional regulator [bacterium]